MTGNLVARLVPMLAVQREERFNVFDVMRHGAHEKQLSNVFAWLLDDRASHKLGTRFQDIFVDAVNASLAEDDRIAPGVFSVRQERNTSADGQPMDIADLVLENASTAIVIENYFTSDGHGHSYEGYRAFGARGGRRSIVVMLCELEDRGALTGGWQEAAVVTYASLLTKLSVEIRSDPAYQRAYPEQCTFIDHMEQRFAKGQHVNDEHAIELIEVLCASGEAGRYGHRPIGDAAIAFGDQLAEEARHQFSESRDLLARVKARLRSYCRTTLVPQLNAELEVEAFSKVVSNWQGIYEWTLNLHGADDRTVRITFGPSAWNANEVESKFATRVPPNTADYTRVFVALVPNEIRQTAVSLQDVLHGLDPQDTRLSDEIVGLLRT